MAQVTCCVCGKTKSDLAETYKDLSDDEYLTGLRVCEKCANVMADGMRGESTTDRENCVDYLQKMLTDDKVLPMAGSYIRAMVDNILFAEQAGTDEVSINYEYKKESSDFQNMIVSSTPTLEGYVIKRYCGFVLSGGMDCTFAAANIDLKQQAMRKGANAIVGVSLCFQDLSTGFSATGHPWLSGTAVEIEKI